MKKDFFKITKKFPPSTFSNAWVIRNTVQHHSQTVWVTRNTVQHRSQKVQSRACRCCKVLASHSSSRERTLSESWTEISWHSNLIIIFTTTIITIIKMDKDYCLTSMTPSIIVIHAHHMATHNPKKSTYSKWDSLLSSGFSNADEKFTWLDKPSFSSQKI